MLACPHYTSMHIGCGLDPVWECPHLMRIVHKWIETGLTQSTWWGGLNPDSRWSRFNVHNVHSVWTGLEVFLGFVRWVCMCVLLLHVHTGMCKNLSTVCEHVYMYTTCTCCSLVATIATKPPRFSDTSFNTVQNQYHVHMYVHVIGTCTCRH